jgi:hypothetical protein
MPRRSISSRKGTFPVGNEVLKFYQSGNNYLTQ